MEPIEPHWLEDPRVHAAFISAAISLIGFAINLWLAKKARAANKADYIRRLVDEIVQLACEHWCAGFEDAKQDKKRGAKILSLLKSLAYEIAPHKKLGKSMSDFRSRITKDFEGESRPVCSLDDDPRIERIHEKADEIKACFK